jgi:hypothetical protein
MRSISVNGHVSEISVVIKSNEKEQGKEGEIEIERYSKAEVQKTAERPLITGYSYYETAE